MAIKQIQNKNASTLSFEETYRNAYNLVLNKNGEMLYNGLQNITKDYLNDLINKNISHLSANFNSSNSHLGETFLKSLKCCWDEHLSCLLKLRDVLKYMDKVYTPNQNVAPTFDLGLNLFRDTVLSYDLNIRLNLFNVISSQIYFERDGQVINRSIVKSCVDILLELIEPNQQRNVQSSTPALVTDKSIYLTCFEPQLIEECKKYYKNESDNLIDSFDIPSYLRRIENRLEEEHNRCLHYLSNHTTTIFQQIVENQMIENKINDILSNDQSGLVNMIDNDSFNDLSRLYNLFNLISPVGPTSLRKYIKSDVIRRGQIINSDVNNINNQYSEKQKRANDSLAIALEWVRETLLLKSKLDNIWLKSFNKDLNVQTAINEGFETFINTNKKASEFISLFIDDNLKKGIKGKNEDETDVILDQTIILFRFLVDKDVFEIFYKRHLARRLIQGRSISDDAERGMLAKLKVECGVQFTQKMEGMFNDMRMSEENMKSFKNYQSNKDNNNSPDLYVNVLTASYWPMPAQIYSCTFPEVMMNSLQQYERFYLQRHSGRKMIWQASHGSIDMKYEINGRKYEINLSTIGGIILLLFNDIDDEWVDYKYIVNITNIPEADIKRNLQSLSFGKYKILIKEQKTKDVKDNDRFKINENFSSNLSKIRIATIANKVESNEERKETDEKVEEERKHQTDVSE